MSGLFLRRLQSDPFLEGVGLVIFDEFHERNLDGDLSLALARRVQLVEPGQARVVALEGPESVRLFADPQQLLAADEARRRARTHGRSALGEEGAVDELQHLGRQREIALWLWRHNGFAHRFGEILKDFTAGEDPHPQSEDKKLQDVLDGFRDHFVNRMRTFGRELAEQIHIIGEQFVTVHIADSDGELRLGYLDPQYVTAVIPMKWNHRSICGLRKRLRLEVTVALRL